MRSPLGQIDLMNGWAWPLTGCRVWMFFDTKMNKRLRIEAWHDAPVLYAETLKSEQKYEETGEIAYNTNTVRANNALAIVIPNIEHFICLQGQSTNICR